MILVRTPGRTPEGAGVEAIGEDITTSPPDRCDLFFAVLQSWNAAKSGSQLLGHMAFSCGLGLVMGAASLSCCCPYSFSFAGLSLQMRRNGVGAAKLHSHTCHFKMFGKSNCHLDWLPPSTPSHGALRQNPGHPAPPSLATPLLCLHIGGEGSSGQVDSHRQSSTIEEL